MYVSPYVRAGEYTDMGIAVRWSSSRADWRSKNHREDLRYWTITPLLDLYPAHLCRSGEPLAAYMLAASWVFISLANKPGHVRVSASSEWLRVRAHQVDSAAPSAYASERCPHRPIARVAH